MEFTNKQYDDPFEVVMVELQVVNEMIKGIMYFPLGKFNRPHPIIMLCFKIRAINKLLLLSPILDLKRHLKSKKFREMIAYINRFRINKAKL